MSMQGKMVKSQHFDGFQPNWHHASCLMEKPGSLKNDIAGIEGWETLRPEDQKRLRDYIGGNASSSLSAPGPVVGSSNAGECFPIEYAKSNRSTCKGCLKTIDKDAVRSLPAVPCPVIRY